MPSHCLDLAYVLVRKPEGGLLKSLALLSWVPEGDVLQHYQKKDQELQKKLDDGVEREKWKNHKIYRQKKDQIILMCQSLNIESSGKKH